MSVFAGSYSEKNRLQIGFLMFPPSVEALSADEFVCSPIVLGRGFS